MTSDRAYRGDAPARPDDAPPDRAPDAGGAPPPPTNPERPGPFPVGVTTCTFYDHARVDPATQAAARGLKTEIWYPAADVARAMPRGKLSDALDRGTNASLNDLAAFALGASVEELDRRFVEYAVRDAPGRDGPFPLIVFSHGSDSFRLQSSFWCEHMASHGYVVAAPDHVGSALATTIAGQLVFADQSDAGHAASERDRPRDIQFVIDEMARLARGDDSRFTGRIDLERIGVAGHSFGGQTTTVVADLDPRIRAISPWTIVGDALARSELPTLLLLAIEDVIGGSKANEHARAWFDALRGPRVRVEFRNGGHYTFTEMYQFRPTASDGVGTGRRLSTGEPITYVPSAVAQRFIDGFTLAFFDRYLKGIEAREAYLRANPMPSELDVVARLGAPPR